MPIHHSIDSENALSVVTVSGSVTVEEAANFIKERQKADDDMGYPVLVDTRAADAHNDLLITDMDLLARLAAETHRRNGGRKEAFVAEDEQNAGLLSLFRKFSLNGHNQRVFAEIDEAIAWLKAALERNPDAASLRWLLARAYLLDGNDFWALYGRKAYHRQ